MGLTPQFKPEPQQRTNSPWLAGGLASNSELGRIPFGRRFLAACCKVLQLNSRLTCKELAYSGTLLANSYESWLEHIQPVTVPLALISQIQRSGGSMLSQLFDGHRQVHAHPHELKVGYPKKHNWPPIDLNDPPDRWFEILFEDIVVRHFRYGYKKMEKYKDTFLFIFLPFLQKQLFLNYLESIDKIDQRDVFDAYMTSYFGAWVNNQNRLGDKKFITAFTPRMAFMETNMTSFFKIYPDGRLISVLRDPKNWFPSAKRHQLDKYGDISKALDQWNESTRSMVRNKKVYGDRVCIITFDDLVQHTESVMRYLADFLNIRFDDILLTPTFNKILIKPNTSFKLENPGIMISALERYKMLSREELKIIEARTGDAYSQALSMVTSIP
ncbi:sulfotransferase [Thermodesulfobacteriota bacterium]